MNSNFERRFVVGLLMLPLIGTLLLNGLYLKYLPLYSGLYWLNEVVTWLIIPLLTLRVLLVRYSVPPADYGLRLPKSRKEKYDLAPQAFTLLMFSLINEFVLYPYLPQLYFLPAAFSYVEVVQLQGSAKLAVAIFFAISAGLVESIFFLGLLEKVVLENVSHPNASIVFVTVSSGLFALIHWEQGSQGVVSAAILGVVYALLYLRIKYLLPFILAHVGLDLMVYL